MINFLYLLIQIYSIYRFGNLEKNGTGWILLWNAKYLDWILYIAQPIDNNAGIFLIFT